MARRSEVKQPDAVPSPQDSVVPLAAGARVWYVKGGETVCRPAILISEGICETRTLVNGTLVQYAHLAYGTLDAGHQLLGNQAAAGPNQRQTYEATAPWDPMGGPGTWHLEDEAPHLTHPEVLLVP